MRARPPLPHYACLSIAYRAHACTRNASIHATSTHTLTPSAGTSLHFRIQPPAPAPPEALAQVVVRPEHLRRLQTTSPAHKLPTPFYRFNTARGPRTRPSFRLTLAGVPRNHMARTRQVARSTRCWQLSLSQHRNSESARHRLVRAPAESQLTRRAAPDYPLDVMWDRAHISVAFPPQRMQRTAAKKFLAEAARGCFIATDSMDPHPSTPSRHALRAR